MSVGELIHCDLEDLSQCSALARHREEAPNCEKVNEVFNGFRASTKDSPGRRSDTGSVTMIKGLHHNAYRCRDSEETRKFYEDFLGLPLVNAFEIEQTMTGRKTGAACCTPSSGSTTARASRSSRRRTCRSSSRTSTTTTCTSRSRSSPMCSRRCSRRARPAGREVRGISDHEFIRSIYFRDPERLRDRADRQGARPRSRRWIPKKSRAREILNDWQSSKKQPVAA